MVSRHSREGQQRELRALPVRRDTHSLREQLYTAGSQAACVVMGTLVLLVVRTLQRMLAQHWR